VWSTCDQQSLRAIQIGLTVLEYKLSRDLGVSDTSGDLDREIEEVIDDLSEMLEGEYDPHVTSGGWRPVLAELLARRDAEFDEDWERDIETYLPGSSDIPIGYRRSLNLLYDESREDRLTSALQLILDLEDTFWEDPQTEYAFLLLGQLVSIWSEDLSCGVTEETFRFWQSQDEDRHLPLAIEPSSDQVTALIALLRALEDLIIERAEEDVLSARELRSMRYWRAYIKKNLSRVQTEHTQEEIQEVIDFTRAALFGEGTCKGYIHIHAAHHRAREMFGGLITYIKLLDEESSVDQEVRTYLSHLRREDRFEFLLDDGWNLAQRVVRGERLDHLKPLLQDISEERGWPLKDWSAELEDGEQYDEYNEDQYEE